MKMNLAGAGALLPGALLLLSALAAAPEAMAGDRRLEARSLAATCATCHGTNGHAEPGSPVLAGMPSAELITQMRLFREGARPSTIMGQISRGYTPRQVELIAEYFAAQKR